MNGDLEAFRSIVNRYSNALLSVAYSVIGDFHEAQDVTQEVFLKCHHQLHTLQNQARLGSWLYAIAYRTSLDYAKKNKKTVPFDETNSPKSDPVHAWLDRHVVHESLWDALQTLEDKNKSAVVLHYLSDWSMKEIGRFLNLSLSAVESRIRRSRESLKRVLADDFELYFRPHRLGSDFGQAVCEQLLKRMGHFYIPVTNKKQTTDWFVRHFQLGTTARGQLQLESGQLLYLLECAPPFTKTSPGLTFSVSDVEDLWLQLNGDGVSVDPVEVDEWFGKMFVFYDPDGNPYEAVEKN
ncbi:sigma-70 family RNA polymerase sigma factor [Cohnella faecalis]|uniref:Sigma-70 family RNA polymerase sigma factor n=2 Tax=Cohnella faecalis TaxID=2315694 RepID=A0A398CK85_9BACL|nr:sigma-70 family RNA polymerase sigma factor [Cohnella faecalis]